MEEETIKKLKWMLWYYSLMALMVNLIGCGYMLGINNKSGLILMFVFFIFSYIIHYLLKEYESKQ